MHSHPSERSSPKPSVHPAGLLNADDQGFAGQLVGLAVAEYQVALGAADRHRARMLLRLLAALTVVNVLHASEVLQLLQKVAQSAVDIAQAGERPALAWIIGVLTRKPQRRRHNLRLVLQASARPAFALLCRHKGPALVTWRLWRSLRSAMRRLV